MNQGLPRIGLVGAGRMGANIALRLRDCGYTVTAVYDVAPTVAAASADASGAMAVASLAEVTEVSDAIITVVSDDAAMLGIFATSGDSLLMNATGKIFVNCATVSPSVHIDVEQRASAAGADAIEACMASSITQAREGTLYLMIGGNADAFARVKPMLDVMSSSLRYVGAAGQAAKVKALVNMVMNSNTAALAEGLGLADALGLDLTMVQEIFSQTGANSRVLETDGADMAAREHDVYFSAAHAAKDSGIALALAHDVGLELPVAAAAKHQYDRMVKHGLGELDKSGVAELTFRERLPK